ncbi:MAG: hypothetical protein IKM34_00070 [Clostridia bacterium]|nr:hypothetical protein [Clostridia bacterium]
MKRILSLLLATLLLTAALFSCGKSESPYDHPEKYVTVPALSSVKVKNSDVQESYHEVMQDLLESMTGEHFQKLADRDAIVQKGDKVHISYTGTPKDTALTLSETAMKAINALESDRVFVIPGAGEVSTAIEDILIGSKIGSELSVSVTYTEDDTDIKELIGKEIAFVIKVHSISRLTVSSRHAVKLKFTAKLADESIPPDTILTLLQGGVETVDLADKEDTFDEAFSVSEILPLLIGKHKYDKLAFTLTLPAEKAKKYGYDRDVAIAFEATIQEASETPALLTDEMVESVTEGQFATAAAYEAHCLNMVKEQLALAAVVDAVTYNDDFPKDLYNEFYEENYKEALYNYLGSYTDMTMDELKNMLTAEALQTIENALKNTLTAEALQTIENALNNTLTAEALQTIENAVHQSTVSELRERFLFEYFFDYFDLSLTKEEYEKELQELYNIYQTQYYYALIHYGISNIKDFEEFFGKDYLEVQFLYEKLPPLLKEEVQFVNE